MILFTTEHQDDKFKPITAELTVFAQRLGRELEQPVGAVVLGSDTSRLVEQLAAWKIDRIITVEDPKLGDYNPDGYVAALKEIIAKHGLGFIAAIASVIAAVAAVTTAVLVALD